MGLSFGLFILSMPLLWHTHPTLVQVIMVLFLSFVWRIYTTTHSPTTKILTFCLSLFSAIFVSMHINGLVDLHLHFNWDRTIFADAHFAFKLQVLQSQARYLPYRFRSWVFSPISYLIFSLGRTMEWLWLDKIVLVYGYAAFIPLVLVFRHIKILMPTLIVIFCSVYAAAISRNPNTSLNYFLLLPYFGHLLFVTWRPLPPKLHWVLIAFNFILLVFAA